MTDHPYSGRNRRRFRRINRDFVARVLDRGGDPVDGWNIVFIRNISKGGVLFSCDKGYLPGALLRLSIDILESQSHVECTASVVRSQATVESQIYDVAVEFKEIQPADAELIEASVEEYVKKLGDLGIQPE